MRLQILLCLTILIAMLPSASLAQSADLPHDPVDPRDKFDPPSATPSPNRLSLPMGRIPLRASGSAAPAFSGRQSVPGSAETLQSLGGMSTYSASSGVGSGGLQSLPGMEIYAPLSDQQGEYDGHPTWWPR